MLLSMYASYHWAKIGKKPYVLRMLVLLIVVSFLSAGSPAGSFITLFTFPFTFLSFPFYVYINEVFVGILWEGDWGSFLAIRFLTLDMYYTKLGGTPKSTYMNFMLAFSFFLLVNFVGAILGYGVSKIRRIREWGNVWKWDVLGAFLGGIFTEIPLVLSLISPEIAESPNGFCLGALFMVGIFVLAIVIGRILWSKISEYYE